MRKKYLLNQLKVLLIFICMLHVQFTQASIGIIEPSKNLNAVLQSQSNTIYGQVISNYGETLPFVNVYIEGTTTGATTDFEGRYEIKNISESTVTLVATFLGFKTFKKTITFSGDERVQVDIEFEESEQLLDQVIVTGTTNPKTKLESSVAITTIKADQIEMRVVQNNADLLKAIPGLWVESTGGEAPANVWVRGFPQSGGYTFLGIMEDGLPVFQSGYNSMPSPDQFFKTDATIKSVEAIRGGSAPIIMQGAGGAVVNYISNSGGNNFRGLAKVSFNPLHPLVRTDLNIGGPMGNNFYYNVGGFYREGQGFYDYGYNANRGGQFKGNVVKRLKKGMVKVNLKYINDKVNWNLPSPYIFKKNGDVGEINGFDLKKDGSAVNEVDTEFSYALPDGSTISGDLKDGFDTELFSASVEFNFDIGNGWFLDNKFRADKINTDVTVDIIIDVAPLVTDPSFSYTYADGTSIGDVANLNGNGLLMNSAVVAVKSEYKNIINRLELKKDWDKNGLTIGIEYFNYQVNNEGSNAIFKKEVTNAPRMLIEINPFLPPFLNVSPLNSIALFDAGGVSRGEGTENTYSFYLTDEYNISENLRLDAGFRYDYKSIDGSNASKDGSSILVGGAGFSLGADVPFDDTAGNWAATLGFNYKLNETSALFARGSRAYNGKKIGDYLADGVDIDYLKDLDNREIYQAELGYKYGSSKASIFASVLYASVKNASSTINAPAPNGLLLGQEAFYSTKTISAEIEAQYIPTKNLLLKLTTTLQDPTYTDFIFVGREGSIVEGQTFDWSDNTAERVPKITIDFTASYKFEKIGVFANYRYYGNRWSTPANNVELKGFGELYAGIGYQITKNFNINVKGANLLNSVALTAGNVRGDQFVDVDLADGTPRIGRRTFPISVFVDLTYTFGK